MKWQPVDCHAHSTFSDGKLSVAEVVERAASLGVRPSLSDHISRSAAPYAMDTVEEVQTYLDALDEYDILRAGEFCWHDDLWRDLPTEVTRRFTHRLGSMHAVRLPDDRLVRAFSHDVPKDMSAREYMEAHAACVENLAREMPVDVFAHPTLLAFPFRQLDPETLWTDEHETRIVDALFDGGVAFEISNRYWPHERIVRRAVERGVRISLGSDGHTWDQVANVARPLALARRLGVPDEELYDPPRHGSKTQSGVGGRALR
jgi:histidinol phosphatase-like PHP family hydrolase